MAFSHILVGASEHAADQSPPADFRARPPGKRYAAEFPVSLFKRTEE